MSEKLKPYRVQVPEETLHDLQERLKQTRWPDELEHAGWNYGIPSEYMRQIVEY